MAKEPPLKQVFKTLQTADDISNILFGRSLKEIFARGIDVLGVELKDQNDPYALLGVRHSAPDKVVDWAYRAMAHEFHPDSGRHPDGEKMKRINEAYDKIKEARKLRKD